MIFSVQRYLEDYFERRQLRDVDQYAVAVANRYAAQRRASSRSHLERSLRSIRTVFFRNNPGLDRATFEHDLVTRLDGRFLKKKFADSPPAAFPGGLARERERLKGRRRSIGELLGHFKAAIEGRAVDSFWISRSKLQLRSRPERIAKALLATFFRGVLIEGGITLRETASGVGFVDLIVLLSRVAHLIEVKLLRSRFMGPSQLGAYMKNEQRSSGWLVVLDARKASRRSPLPTSVLLPSGKIRLMVIDVNPVPPSKLR
jgi:hypothetical protein